MISNLPDIGLLAGSGAQPQSQPSSPSKAAAAGNADFSTGGADFSAELKDALESLGNRNPSSAKTQGRENADSAEKAEALLEKVEGALEGLSPDQIVSLAKKLETLEKELSADPSALDAFWRQLMETILKAMELSGGNISPDEILSLLDSALVQAGEESALQFDAAKKGELWAAPAAKGELWAAPLPEEAAKPVMVEQEKKAPRPAGKGEAAPSSSVETVEAVEAVETVEAREIFFFAAEGSADESADPYAKQQVADSLRKGVFSKLAGLLKDVVEHGKLPGDIEKLRLAIETRSAEAGSSPKEAATLKFNPNISQARFVALMRGAAEAHEEQKPAQSSRPSQGALKAVYGQLLGDDIMKIFEDRVRAANQASSAAEAAHGAQSAQGGQAKADGQMSQGANLAGISGKGGEVPQGAEAQQAETARFVYDNSTVERFLLSAKESIKMWIRKNLSAIEVRIEPPELGKIQIKSVVQDGKMGTLIIADTAAARDLLVAHRDELKALIEENGLKMAGFFVELQNKDGDAQDSRRRNSRGFSMEEILSTEGEDAAERTPAGLINKVA